MKADRAKAVYYRVIHYKLLSDFKYQRSRQKPHSASADSLHYVIFDDQFGEIIDVNIPNGRAYVKQNLQLHKTWQLANKQCRNCTFTLHITILQLHKL